MTEGNWMFWSETPPAPAGPAMKDHRRTWWIPENKVAGLWVCLINNSKVQLAASIMTFSDGKVACYKNIYSQTESESLSVGPGNLHFHEHFGDSYAHIRALGVSFLSFSPQRAPNWKTEAEGAKTGLSGFPLSQVVNSPMERIPLIL